MHSQDWQVLDALRRWQADGRHAALVTVTKTWGSAPRPAGAWMALRDDGLVQGSVSGGCIEDDLIARMRAGEFSAVDGGRPRLPLVKRYGVTADEAARFGLPCGGTLELVIEPAPDVGQLLSLAAHLSAASNGAPATPTTQQGAERADARRDMRELMLRRRQMRQAVTR